MKKVYEVLGWNPNRGGWDRFSPPFIVSSVRAFTQSSYIQNTVPRSITTTSFDDYGTKYHLVTVQDVGWHTERYKLVEMEVNPK